jgi:ABC-type multidrug transport system fused ATPase/permease subunit
MIPSLLAALSVLTLAMLAWVAATWAIFAPHGSVFVEPAVVLGITAVTLGSFEFFWLRRKEPPDGIRYWLASLGAVVLTLFGWIAAVNLVPGAGYAPRQVLPGFTGFSIDDGTYLLAPAIAWALALLALVLVRWFFSRTVRLPGWRKLHRATDRVRARLLFLVVAWAVLAVMWQLGAFLEHRQFGSGSGAGALGGLTAVLAAAFAQIQRLLARDKQPSAGGKMMARIKPLLPQILAYAVVVLMILGVVIAIVSAHRNGVSPVWIAVGAAVVTGLMLVLMDPNEVGFHSFYRARLVRAYSGASNNERPGPNRETEEIDKDDIRLDNLTPSALRPFPLVCLAANDLASKDDMANLSRGARSAVLSQAGCSVGDTWAPWDKYRQPASLGSAITASGAAFNSLMGSKTKAFGPAVTFLMTAMNLRLGMWIPHPANPKKKNFIKLTGRPFYREMFGAARTEDVSEVHLSDGAHFENLAVYELIRRHCRVILVSDCGQDGDSAFDDLGNLVRRVREDFGVDIRIDTRPIRPGEDGLSGQYMVAGDIHYPDGDTGVLLFFKPAIVGGEPADVTQYRTRNAAFPHESTIDQFYDAAQWESYRRLGEHAVRTAFRTVLDQLDLAEHDKDGKRLENEELRPRWMEAFARARREWFPEPAGFDQRLSHFADRMAELEEALRQPGCELLLRQVYKELDELDVQQKKRTQLATKIAIASTEAKETPGGGAPASSARNGSAPDQQAGALHLIRRALLLMQEVFEGEDLDRNYSHPLYLGVMNWFARWAYAPLFRMWWPLLKTLYPQPFTRFLEKHFSLTAVDHPSATNENPEQPKNPEDRAKARVGEEMFTWIHYDGDGFAKACWVRMGKDPKPEKREVISYSLRMKYENQKSYGIQAAQVVAAREGDALAWDARNFFVPAGLWGVGIGTDFLRQLSTGLPRRTDQTDQVQPTHLVVRVAANPLDGAAGKRWAANEMQLYRTAGFVEADEEENGQLKFGDKLITPPDLKDDDDDEPGAGAASLERMNVQWMIAPVTLKPAAGEPMA